MIYLICEIQAVAIDFQEKRERPVSVKGVGIIQARRGIIGDYVLRAQFAGIPPQFRRFADAVVVDWIDRRAPFRQKS